MKISYKLAASTIGLVLLILGAIASTFFVMASMEGSMSSIVVDRLVPAKDLKEIGDLYAVNIVDTSHKIRSGALDWDKGYRSIDESLVRSKAIWTAYLATYLTAEEKQLAESASTVLASMDRSLDKLKSIVAGHDKAALDAYVSNELYPTIDPFSEKISALVDLQIRIGQEEFVRAQATRATNSTLMLVFSLVALGVSGLALWIILVGVSRPLNTITDRMKQLAGGTIDIDVPYAGRRDEIGAIAGALEIFRQAAHSNRRLEQEAEENRRRAEADRIETQRKAEADAAERLRIATAGLAAGLRRLAGGDLTVQLNDAFAQEFEALRSDFNQSVQQLASVLSEVSLAVNGMDDGSREIADGAGDLSKRTEQQAAALEETAAALDEITTNVSNSAKLTQEAKHVADRANASALHSAEVVSNAEEAMRRIEGSSQQISNIIGVIDEIAFQTNLLALNAGVEAARAGEAGKGFAVVAQEVRELAQRSAQAAKEIKALIQNSTSEVESGVKLVRDTGEALGNIGTYIVEINQHVAAIAISAKEQSTGLSEVNIAVNQMDQTTQQNAAMVEQSTAAATSLSQEAARLRGLIAQFQIDAGAAQAKSLRKAASAMDTHGSSARHQRTAAAPRKAASGGNWQEF
ncbi:methyl-accepting chemotaxis protein [Rhizobium sp. LjRoot30]|uniref:methyl-accepting chemotaxis protein n=1 Tax=Rhizobium sp. LjRoot30 TaxID=3342320 RepID=UPI003ECF77D9